MANTAIKSTPRSNAASTDKDPVYKAAVNELKTLRSSIEHSSDKWSLTKGKAASTITRESK